MVLPQTLIHESIIKVLTLFADNITRYYNIDMLANGSTSGNQQEPISQWHKDIVEQLIEKHVSPQLMQGVHNRADAINSIYGAYTLILHTKEDGTAIKTLEQASNQTGMTRLSTPYVRLYVLQIARFLGSVMAGIGREAQSKQLEDIPCLSEFYVIFNAKDS